ncbi:MAG: mucoidy inhibitor MuiA family protein, partial [Bacteroidota bacterium]
ALVERSAQKELKKGDHKIVFENLPQGIDPDSIQVNGSANVILQDVKLKNVYPKSSPDKERKELENEKQRLEDLIVEIEDNTENLNGQKTFLQNMAATASESQKKSIFVLMPPEKLIANLDYYRKSLDKTDLQIRKLSKEKEELQISLQTVLNEQNLFNDKDLKEMLQIELGLFVEEDTKVDLKLSYIIFNASWKPVYDLRALSTEKKMNVSYNAVISQTTGEKWEDVRLKLSTAQAHLSATQPELSPWYLDFYVEPHFDKMMEVSRGRKERKKSKASMRSAKNDISEEAEEIMEPMLQPEAVVETGATSVVFAIPGKNTISDNGEEHKVGISVFEFDADFQYNSVPKISPFAFLTAKVKNTSDFPMLQGKSNVFLDNNFVTNSHIPLVAPNEKFNTSLGIDEGIKIEHKLINKFHKDEGIFSKKAKISYEFKIIIKNNKITDENIVVEDQIPISQNNDIKVELIEPKYKDDIEKLKMTESKFLKWEIKLNAEEEYVIPIKFHIEYPREESIVGL